MLGSFINVVTHRLPRMLEAAWRCECQQLLCPKHSTSAKAHYNLVVPRSRCPSCDQAIAAWHNIPLLSYALLKGRCAHCRATISPRYPLTELITAVLLTIVAWQFGLSWQTLSLATVTCFLISLTIIDARTMYLPDCLTLPLLWLGLLAALLGISPIALADAVWGAIGGYSILWAVFQLFKLLTGREGMGYGDFKLLAALGAWAGWQALPLIVLLASAAGAAVGLLLILIKNRDGRQAIPFGPYLATAGWISLMGQEHFATGYLSIFSL